jgi:hypothetical protein
MNNTNRRGFLRGFGLAGLFAAGAVGAKVIIEHKEEDKKVTEDISHLAPDSVTMFTLQGNPKPVDPSINPYYIQSNQDYQNKVHMAAGKDNRLWIKVNDQWYRLAIENHE